MEPTDLEAKDADYVAGVHIDSDRTASPSGLDILMSAAEF